MPNKIKLGQVSIERVTDECPDLSYLGRYSDSDATNRKNEIAIEREYSGVGEYHWFIAAEVDNMKQAQQNYRRMESYENQQWCMLGIIAKAQILVPSGQNDGFTVQTIRSGGIYGVESDSEESYFEELEEEEIEDLKEQLGILGIAFPKDMEVTRA